MQGYGVTAQFYDPLMSAAHADIDRQIADALTGLDVTMGPVVDIGAGTGLSTMLIATTLPAAEILAVEPDPTMRVALMARIWSRDDLRARVSLLPFDAMSAPLPDRIAGAVFSASLVHFSPSARVKLWGRLAERLAPDGRIVIEIQCPEAIDISETEMAKVQIGQIVYGGSAKAERLSPDRQRWTITYRAWLEENEIACETTSYDCWAISPDDVLAECAAAGLAGNATDSLVTLQPRQARNRASTSV